MLNQELLSQDLIEKTIKYAKALGGEFVELYAENRKNSVIRLSNKKLDNISTGLTRGVGIRVITKGCVGYAYTSDISEISLMLAAEAACALSDKGLKTEPQAIGEIIDLTKLPESIIEPFSVSKEKKINLIMEADDIARSYSDRIAQVSVNFSDSFKEILIANSDGIFITNSQVRTHFSVTAVAEGDSGLQTGYQVVAGTKGFELFDLGAHKSVANDAARIAELKLQARPAPSGKLPIVLKKGSGGILFHEACGHGLEADHIKKNSSVFTGLLNKKVASNLVTLVDDATKKGEWGAFDVDDEGNPGKCNVLIRDGELVSYMTDRLRNDQNSKGSTSNGRRQSYMHVPMVRMTNTYITPGDTDPQDIISDTKQGIYVAALSGGQVNTTTGDFVFGTLESYMIEDGRITYPLRDANLIGSGKEVLEKIDAVGSDFDMSPGMCGKDGQQVPVGCGQPTLRVASMTVGGTSQ
jgi:TldD protein